MSDASTIEWNEESKLVKLRRVCCPKGHFLSWHTYHPVGKVDQDGNPAEEGGTFCCKACGRYYGAKHCKEQS